MSGAALFVAGVGSCVGVVTWSYFAVSSYRLDRERNRS